MNVEYATGSLGWAIQTGNLQQVKYLLSEAKCPVDLNTPGASPLVLALGLDDDLQRKRIFNFLLSKGADISHKDKTTRRDVFAWACHLGREQQAIKMLKSLPGEFGLREADTTGYLPIHHAVKIGNPLLVYHLVKEMLRYGVNIDIPNLQDGLTPLLMAKRYGYELISQILLTEGKACPTQFDTRTFRTKTRWSEVGLDERNKDDLKSMIAELRINGSARPHTSYQRRLEHSSQIVRPQSTRIQSPDRSSVNTPRRVTRSAFSGQRSAARPPSQELYRDLQLSEVKQVADGRIRVKDIRNLKEAHPHSDTQSSNSSGVLTRGTRGTTTPNDKLATWTKLNNLMSLSDKASVWTTERFARSISDVNSSNQRHGDSEIEPQPQESHEAHNPMMITSMMSAVSQQMSSAFRKPAVPKPKIEPPKPKPPKKVKKGSTLAYIMQTGKQRRGSRAHNVRNNTTKMGSGLVKFQPCKTDMSKGYSFGHRSEIKKQSQVIHKPRHNLPAIRT